MARGCYVLVDPLELPDAATTISKIRENGNIVGCYVSVGTCENWRPDSPQMKPACTTREWSDWEGEFFVSDVELALSPMLARFTSMAEIGCEFVEFDNMDWAQDPQYNQEFGIEATPEKARTYLTNLCDSAHALGMKCMAKNATAGLEIFDGGTFESYPEELDWWESADLKSFVDAGAPAVVFHYGERDCKSVTTWYRQRYGAGLSVLCENPALGGYEHTAE